MLKRPGIVGPHVPLGVTAIGHNARTTGTHLLGSYALAGFRPVMRTCAFSYLCQANILKILLYLSRSERSAFSTQAECDKFQSLRGQLKHDKIFSHCVCRRRRVCELRQQIAGYPRMFSLHEIASPHVPTRFVERAKTRTVRGVTGKLCG